MGGRQRAPRAPARCPWSSVGAALALLVLISPVRAVAQCGPSALSRDAPTALILSGGGAKGAWEAGVTSALLRGGLSPILAAGSSAGALTAVMIADGRVDRLEAVWRGLTADQVFAFRPSVFFAGLLPGWLTLFTITQLVSLLAHRPLRAIFEVSLALVLVRDLPV